MECPSCKNQVNLKEEENFEGNCPHCGFYIYLRHTLRIACTSYLQIDKNEDIYFKNIHQRIYNPFINEHIGQLAPLKGAISIGEYLIKQFKNLLKDYPKEDLLFMMLGLRELATWKIHLEPDDVWAAVHARNLSHVFSNLISYIEQETFGENGIMEDTDIISAFVLTEEIDKIISNVFNTHIFGWEPTLTDIIKTRIENDYLSLYHQYFEVEELQKPEEIIFNNTTIEKFLGQRNIQTDKIKKSVNDELDKLFGFSFLDLHDFRKVVISVAEENGQVFDICPLTEDKYMRALFIFKEQLSEVFNQEKLLNIIQYMSYKPSFKKGDKLDKLTDPYLDYKFIFEYEDLLAFGIMDSANSITMFENIASSDHFIQNIFGQFATKVFKKAQENTAYLIGMKIAESFFNKENFFVPIQQKGVPLVNFKTVNGNGIKKKIVNQNNMDLGDIDAVCVDIQKKQLILMEVKYYKPAVRNMDMIKKDKKIFEDIPKIKARAEWFKDNIEDIVKAWGLESGSYTVFTYLVTGRPNFYGKQLEEENEEIKYFTYDEIIRL